MIDYEAFKEPYTSLKGAYEIHDGTVEIIDHYSGGHVSIDVMSGDTLYKHLSLTDVIEHVESRSSRDLIGK